MFGVVRHALNVFYNKAEFIAPDERDPGLGKRDFLANVLNIIENDYGFETKEKARVLINLYAQKAQEILQEHKNHTGNEGELV